MADRRDEKSAQGTNPSQRRIKLTLPRHGIRPEDLLDFIELPEFTKRWAALGLDDEDDLSALQLSIMAGPTSAKPIKGTNGIRKLRFAPRKWKSGKSGAARVLYVYFEEYGLVVLCLVYGKNEVDSIFNTVKRYLNKLVGEMKNELRLRYTDK
jgi:hypothetical protein